MSSNNVNKYWKRRESITHILNSRHIAEANVWDKVDKWDSSYLSDLHWATIPSHKPCRWTHLAHTHSLCRQCKSSSNWLPLSVWPITQEYFICLKFSFSRKPFFSQMRTCFHTVIFFLKTNFPPPNLYILRNLKYMDWSIPHCVRVQMWISIHSMLDLEAFQ